MNKELDLPTGDGHCFNNYTVCNLWNRQLSNRKPIDLDSLKCKIYL